METLQAEVRAGRGKGPARQLRMAGQTPAVLYGPGGDPVALSVDPKELRRVLMTPHRRNALIELSIGDDKQLSMVKDVQIHPVTREARHVDFYRVSVERTVTVPVPLRTEGRAAGVAAGGKLSVHFRAIPVTATPDKIPAEITVDVTEIEMGGTCAVKDLSLADGVTVALAPERALMGIEMEKIREEEDADAAAGEGDAAAAAPAES